MNSQASIYQAFPDLEVRWSAFAEWDAQTAQFYATQLSGRAKSVLEPGCGYGRILAPLAREGIEVCGFDSVPERIDLARRMFEAENLAKNVEFLIGSMPDIPTARTFDAVILTVNAIGYVLTAESKLRLFRRIREALNPGGRLIFDFQRGEQLLRRRWLRSWLSLCGELGGDAQLHSRVCWDAKDDCIIEEFTLREGRSPEKIFRDHLRFGSVREMEQLLAEAGFEITKRWGGFDASPLRFWSQTAILEARATPNS